MTEDSVNLVPPEVTHPFPSIGTREKLRHLNAVFHFVYKLLQFMLHLFT